MTTTTTAPTPTGVRHNLINHNADDLRMILFPDGSHYTDPNDNVNAWPRYVAIAIARNVAQKRRTTVRVVKVKVEEPANAESSFDRIVSYVDSLKGRALTETLVAHGLTKGGDPVASKRQRLITHLTKCWE